MKFRSSDVLNPVDESFLHQGREDLDDFQLLRIRYVEGVSKLAY